MRRAYLTVAFVAAFAQCLLSQGTTIRNAYDIQSVTVAIFNTSATDPNVDSPVAAAVTYTVISCGLPLGSVQSTNPTRGYWEWPPSSGKECVVDIAAQVTALSAGTYKSSLKLYGGRYGEFSDNFTRS